MGNQPYASGIIMDLEIMIFVSTPFILRKKGKKMEETTIIL